MTKWYVMEAKRWGWERLQGPFTNEQDAQRAIKDARFSTINPIRVMKETTCQR